ncbi:MAG: hypothetical protein WB626_03095 [Bacteroidota bacterium]
MQEYFRNLNTLDPLFHSLVVATLRRLGETEGRGTGNIEDLGPDQELEILREYSVALYREYRSLRSVFLENMVLRRTSVGPAFRNN